MHQGVGMEKGQIDVFMESPEYTRGKETPEGGAMGYSGPHGPILADRTMGKGLLESLTS
jgi:hypothetical protein